MSDTVPKDSTFDTEIITNAGSDFGKFVVEHPNLFPHLKALALVMSDLDTHFHHLPRDLPAVTFLHITLNHISPRFTDVLCSKSITSLIISSFRSLRSLSFDQWSLPSLRHLQIQKIHKIGELKKLLTALSHLGKELRALDITFGVKLGKDDEYDDGIMDNLWNHCPNLEKLRIPLYISLPHPPHPPSRPHRLRYLFSSDWSTKTGHEVSFKEIVLPDLKDMLISFCHAMPELAAVRHQHRWKEAMSDNHLVMAGDSSHDIVMEEMEMVCQWMIDAAAQVKALGMAVRFEDNSGRTWEESHKKRFQEMVHYL